MEYSYSSILLNDRELRISQIISGNVEPHDEFETSTLRFIRDWIGGRREIEIHTSGSTGTPKKITITREQMMASATATQRALSLKKGDTALVCLDTRYIAGQMMLVRCFTTGMAIRAITPSANPLQHLPDDDEIDFASFVPYQLHSILRSNSASRLDEIPTIIVGGAPLSVEDEELLQQFGCRVYVTYGMTETVSHVALRQVNGPEKSKYYRALPGIDLEVDGRSCLIVDCPYISAKLTTNDVVNLIDRTTFEWLGRFDNVINSGGIKVYPEVLENELEPLIRGMNLANRFVVSSVADPGFGEKVVLVLEERSPGAIDKVRILSDLQGLFPKYGAPKALLTEFPFPETPNGKVDRQELKKRISKRL